MRSRIGQAYNRRARNYAEAEGEHAEGFPEQNTTCSEGFGTPHRSHQILEAANI